MAKIVLISCVKSKASTACQAKDMYISPLFKGMYHYAKSLMPDYIYILSAKYGLLEEEKIIYPYNETLKSKTEKEKKLWSYYIIQNLLKKGHDLDNDEFIILAGNEYRKYIIQKFKNYSIPLKGLTLFKQIQYLSKL